MGKRSYNRGFTLIEVILAVALISTVITIGINTYLFSDKTFKDAEKNIIIQDDLRYVAKYISDQLRTAYAVELTSGYKEPEKDSNNIIYKDGNGSIVHVYKESDVVKTKLIADPTLSDYKYNISFNKTKDKSGNERYNMIEFEISVLNSDSRLKSSVIAQNMSEKDKIEGSNTSSYIYYDSFIIEEEIIPDDPSTPSCFTRRALTGTSMQPAIILLRDFRDSYMLNNMLGTKFTSYYYRISPTISAFISDSETLKFLVRILLIPFIFIAAIFTAQGGFTYALVTIMQIILVIVLYRQLKTKHKKLQQFDI